MIESINKVEICGIVNYVLVQRYANKTVGRLVVSTETPITSRDGTVFMESSKHAVYVEPNEWFQKLEFIREGDAVHVIGRIKSYQCHSNHGYTTMFSELIAEKLWIMKESISGKERR